MQNIFLLKFNVQTKEQRTHSTDSGAIVVMISVVDLSAFYWYDIAKH